MTDAQADAIMDWFDRHYHRGEFPKVNAVVSVITASVPTLTDVDRMALLLAATLPAADKLPARPALVEAVRARIAELAPDRVEAIMRGL